MNTLPLEMEALLDRGVSSYFCVSRYPGIQCLVHTDTWQVLFWFIWSPLKTQAGNLTSITNSLSWLEPILNIQQEGWD